jgi:DNA-directed RNA polymerase subunit RPC12/RpoP
MDEITLIKCSECNFIHGTTETPFACPECGYKIRITSKAEFDFYTADWADFYQQSEELKGK